MDVNSPGNNSTCLIAPNARVDRGRAEHWWNDTRFASRPPVERIVRPCLLKAESKTLFNMQKMFFAMQT